MKRIVIITTGGTISMKADPVTKKTSPALSGVEMVRSIQGLEEVGVIRVESYSNIPSSHITIAMMFGLAGRVKSLFAAGFFSAFSAFSQGTSFHQLS